MNKKYNGQEQIEKEIINLQKQLLGAQYLLDRLKLWQNQQQKDEEKVERMSTNKRMYFKVLSTRVPCEQESKREYAQQLLEQDQQMRNKQFQIRQLISLNQQLQRVEQKLLIKRQQQNNSLKQHYRYMRPSRSQQVINRFIKQKLIKNIQNLQSQISQVYEIGGRSSISSSSIGNYAIEDWINQEKEEKMMKEQEKFIEEITMLENKLYNL